MADRLIRRHGTWHFVGRVPTEFAAFDRREMIRHSTKNSDIRGPERSPRIRRGRQAEPRAGSILESKAGQRIR
jgi:hypothetical protein